MDAIAWFEYSGLMVAKISDCEIVGGDIYTNMDGTAKKDSNRFLIFCQGTPDQIPDKKLESLPNPGPTARFFQSSEPHDPHPAASRRGKGERIVVPVRGAGASMPKGHEACGVGRR